ncbi:MAG TPA: glycine cleavage system protein GcvH [Candidatus Micrarchaeia archaeon]|nr:glycine cleavage system protein GcvH [Candidatus Micrarchaeia archaeon]
MPDPRETSFTRTHEWVRAEGEGAAVVGITEHAQQQLGDVIFLELPTVGARFVAGDRFGTVESVKAASDLYTPVGGSVTAVNEQVASAPELVNQSPQADGWLIRLAIEGGWPDDLLDAAGYQALVAGEAG